MHLRPGPAALHGHKFRVAATQISSHYFAKNRKIITQVSRKLWWKKIFVLELASLRSKV